MHTYLVTHQILDIENNSWAHGALTVTAESNTLARKAAIDTLKHNNPGRRCIVRKVTELSDGVLKTKAVRST